MACRSNIGEEEILTCLNAEMHKPVAFSMGGNPPAVHNLDSSRDGLALMR